MNSSKNTKFESSRMTAQSLWRSGDGLDNWGIVVPF